jgi:pimeloyl-ACP methyl ester carboxylesterase
MPGTSRPAERAVSSPTTKPRRGSRLTKPFVLTRLMLWSARHLPDRTPASVGLSYDDVEFSASDGVRLRGWFLPAGGEEAAGGEGDGIRPGPAVVVVHGWLWNRLGNVAGQVPFTDRDVDFLPAARALHDAGISVLLMDLSNHGESGGRFPVTFGLREWQDVVAAVDFLRARPDVDPGRVGALGCSMGGNAVIYGAAECGTVKAILAVQPAVVSHFNENFARDELGRPGPLMVRSMDLLYRVLRVPPPSHENPAVPAVRLGDTVVRYVQGTGDPWGTMADVRAMAAATPHALPVVEYPSTGRYEGYRYVTEQPAEVAAFFAEHL